MKEFLINLLILLSSPFYIIGVLVAAMISIALRVGEIISDKVNNYINFIKSDYIEAYKILKGKFKNGRKKRKNKKETNR